MDKVKPGSFLGLPEATVQFRLRGLSDGPEARKYCQFLVLEMQCLFSNESKGW